MKPFLEKRKEYEARPAEIWEILRSGAKKAQGVAGETMKEVRSALKLPPAENLG